MSGVNYDSGCRCETCLLVEIDRLRAAGERLAAEVTRLRAALVGPEPPRDRTLPPGVDTLMEH